MNKKIRRPVLLSLESLIIFLLIFSNYAYACSGYFKYVNFDGETEPDGSCKDPIYMQTMIASGTPDCVCGILYHDYYYHDTFCNFGGGSFACCWLNDRTFSSDPRDYVWDFVGLNSCPDIKDVWVEERQEWTTEEKYNGAVCMLRAGNDCEYYEVFSGKWDYSENHCVYCNGVLEDRYDDCQGIIDIPNECESACGADSACDDKVPGTCIDRGTYCTSSCSPVDRDSSQTACESTGPGCTPYHWNAGGEVASTTCCGDDGGEYYRTCSDTTGTVCSKSNDDEACCDSSSDCVYNGNCYPDGTDINDVDPGFSDNQIYCIAGTWKSPCKSTFCPSKTCSQTYACPSPCTGTKTCECSTQEKCIDEGESAPSCTRCTGTTCKSIEFEKNEESKKYDTISLGGTLFLQGYICSTSGSASCVAACYERDDAKSYCNQNDPGCQDCKAAWTTAGEKGCNPNDPLDTECCCGDDPGEFPRSCSISGSSSFSCVGSTVCCDSSSDCAYNNQCYGEDQCLNNAYCSGGVWKDPDLDSVYCTGCGLVWANGENQQEKCCGDDPQEQFNTSSGVCCYDEELGKSVWYEGGDCCVDEDCRSVCDDPNLDFTGRCLSDYSCKCTACETDDECEPGYCCPKAIPDTQTQSECLQKYGDNCLEAGSFCGSWLCLAHSPAKWKECNEENLNEQVITGNKTYICAYDNGYKWITSSVVEPLREKQPLLQLLSFFSRINKFVLHFFMIK